MSKLYNLLTLPLQIIVSRVFKDVSRDIKAVRISLVLRLSLKCSTFFMLVVISPTMLWGYLCISYYVKATLCIPSLKSAYASLTLLKLPMHHCTLLMLPMYLKHC